MRIRITYLTAAVFSLALLAAVATRSYAEQSGSSTKKCNPQESIAQLKAALVATPGNGDLMVQLALNYEEVKWYGKSVELWDSYLAGFPQGTQFSLATQHAAMNHRWIGSNMFLMGQPVAMAEEQLSQAIALDPSMAEAYVWLARAYMSEARFGSVDAVLNKAKNIAPVNANLAAIGSEAAAMKGNEGSSYDEIQQGIALYDKGDTSQAMSNFRSVQNDRPQLTEVSYWLGRIYFEQKQYAKAIPEFQELSKSDAGSYRYSHFLENAQMMNGASVPLIMQSLNSPYTYDSFAMGSRSDRDTSAAGRPDMNAAKLSDGSDKPIIACEPR